MLQKDLQVDGLVEASIVHELAVLTWKRMRLERLEQSHVKTLLEKKFQDFEYRQVGLDIPYRAERYVSDPSSIDGYNFDQLRGFISAMQSLLDGEVTLDSVIELKKLHPVLFDWLGEEAEELGLKHEATPQILFDSYMERGSNSKVST